MMGRYLRILSKEGGTTSWAIRTGIFGHMTSESGPSAIAFANADIWITQYKSPTMRKTLEGEQVRLKPRNEGESHT